MHRAACGHLVRGGLTFPLDAVEPLFAWTFSRASVEITAREAAVGQEGFQEVPRGGLVGPWPAEITVPVRGLTFHDATRLTAVVPDSLSPATLPTSATEAFTVWGRDFREPVVALSCQALDGTTTELAATATAWSYGRIDAMFAVDPSGSMDDDAATLVAAFGDFVAGVEAVTTGWHMGVVTYDHGCVNHGVLDASTPDLFSTFTDAATLGEDREIAHDEALFVLVDRALAQTAAGACSEGLARPGVPLHVIVVSDEPERSEELALAWTWDWYLRRFQAAVSSPSLLTVSGVVDLAGCGEGAYGYVDMIAATRGEELDVCAPDWGAHVGALAVASTALAWTLPLDSAADPATSVVTVDGTPATGWAYDPSVPAVVFSSLEPGQTVEITWSEASACE